MYRCYGLYVCAPQNSYVEALPTRSAIVLGVGAFGS